MNKFLHFSWVIARSEMAGSHSRCVFHSWKKPSYFSRVIVPFYVSISCEGDFQCLCSSPTLGSLSQKNCDVLYKTETPNNFLHLVKHVKCLHENSKLMFSHRRLPTLLIHQQSPTLLLCFHKPVMVFLECRRHSHFGWWFWSYHWVWHITQVFHTNV